MTPVEFALKWTGSTQTARAASQEHFIDLCRMVGAPRPARPAARGAVSADLERETDASLRAPTRPAGRGGVQRDRRPAPVDAGPPVVTDDAPAVEGRRLMAARQVRRLGVFVPDEAVVEVAAATVAARPGDRVGSLAYSGSV